MYIESEERKMTKETRQILKELKLIANPVNTFETLHNKGHMKVRCHAVNDNGEVVRLQFHLGGTPSDRHWTKQFRRQVRKYLAHKEVSNVSGF